jgi:hypothetical protein
MSPATRVQYARDMAIPTIALLPLSKGFAMKRLPIGLLAAALTLAMHGAFANDIWADGAPQPDTAVRAEQFKAQLAQRFDAADANHDGKLTREEAKKMPRVAQRFDQIDTAHAGYVTKEQVQTSMLEMAKARGYR